MKETTQKELERLSRKYGKYGITAETITRIFEAAPQGTSEHAALVGVRMSLALNTGETEYFNPRDVASVTGETDSEVKERMKELGVTEYRVTNILDLL